MASIWAYAAACASVRRPVGGVCHQMPGGLAAVLVAQHDGRFAGGGRAGQGGAAGVGVGGGAVGGRPCRVVAVDLDQDGGGQGIGGRQARVVEVAAGAGGVVGVAQQAGQAGKKGAVGAVVVQGAGQRLVERLGVAGGRRRDGEGVVDGQQRGRRAGGSGGEQGAT
ncbi:hypothetical protein ACH4FX_41470 [Streptomyces sp. NPDC018019]|uniref:hypothetical protein n=1 Tax=Streptomyces sp. NPDC018019 TaxID=3365030 RepID=UPI00379C9767